MKASWFLFGMITLLLLVSAVPAAAGHEALAYTRTPQGNIVVIGIALPNMSEDIGHLDRMRSSGVLQASRHVSDNYQKYRWYEAFIVSSKQDVVWPTGQGMSLLVSGIPPVNAQEILLLRDGREQEFVRLDLSGGLIRPDDYKIAQCGDSTGYVLYVAFPRFGWSPERVTGLRITQRR